MKTIYTVADLRNDLSVALRTVSDLRTPVVVKKYNKPIARIVPMEKSPKKDWDAIAAKYFGMWSGPGYEWAAKIGKPSRHFRKRNYWK